jgi:hypothetical protein
MRASMISHAIRISFQATLNKDSDANFEIWSGQVPKPKYLRIPLRSVARRRKKQKSVFEHGSRPPVSKLDSKEEIKPKSTAWRDVMSYC